MNIRAYWNRRATIYYMKKDYGRSLADIREVLKREPRHFGALAGLGLILQDLGDNKQALINVKPEDLDTVSGFGFVRLSVTVGVAASQTAAQVLGINGRELPANTANQAAVVQVV